MSWRKLTIRTCPPRGAGGAPPLNAPIQNDVLSYHLIKEKVNDVLSFET